jgi:hypothetical protein
MSDSFTVYFCPACRVTRRTQKRIAEHAKACHGLTRSEALGGWTRPADWNPLDEASKTRRVR